jgi:hypothetical protein
LKVLVHDLNEQDFPQLETIKNDYMIINGSPKKKGGASAFFASVLRCMLFPNMVTIKSIGISRDYQEIFDNLQNTDAVVFSVPLYIDSILSHFIHFLKEMEQYCKNFKFC